MAKFQTDKSVFSNPSTYVDDINFKTTRPVDFDRLSEQLVQTLRGPSQAYPVSFYGVNLLEGVANLFKNKTYGKGIEVTSENPQVQLILDTFFKEIDYFNFFCENESLISTGGAAIIFIEYVDNQIIGKTANPGNINIAEYDETPYKSELTIVIGRGISQRLVFTPTMTECKYVISTELDEKEVRDFLHLRDYTIKHNFNQKPIFFMLNQPAYSLYGTSLSKRKPDMMNCLGYQAMMNKLLQTAYYELEMGKTRAYGMLSKQQFETINNNPKEVYKSFVSGLNAVLAHDKLDYAPGPAPRGLEVIQASPTFGNYLVEIDHILQMTKRAVGLSADDQDQGIQRTALEVDTVMSEGNETIALRKNGRIKQIKKLVIRSLLIINGTGTEQELEPLIKVELKENIGTDRGLRLQEAQQMYASNIMSLRGMLRYVDDLSKEESDTKFQEIIKERTEELEMLAATEGAVEQEIAGEEGEKNEQ